MPVLMTGCFDDSDGFIMERYKIRGLYVYEDGFDPLWKNNDNRLAVFHSDMLLKEYHTWWTNLDLITQTLNPQFALGSVSHWKERAVNLMTDMDKKADGKDWLWKDTRLMVTIPLWDKAVRELAPARDMTRHILFVTNILYQRYIA